MKALEKKGITLSKKYSMESNLEEMKGEYEQIKAEKEKTLTNIKVKHLNQKQSLTKSCINILRH